MSPLYEYDVCVSVHFSLHVLVLYLRWGLFDVVMCVCIVIEGSPPSLGKYPISLCLFPSVLFLFSLSLLTSQSLDYPIKQQSAEKAPSEPLPLIPLPSARSRTAKGTSHSRYRLTHSIPKPSPLPLYYLLAKLFAQQTGDQQR